MINIYPHRHELTMELSPATVDDFYEVRKALDYWRPEWVHFEPATQAITIHLRTTDEFYESIRFLELQGLAVLSFKDSI